MKGIKCETEPQENALGRIQRMYMYYTLKYWVDYKRRWSLARRSFCHLLTMCVCEHDENVYYHLHVHTYVCTMDNTRSVCTSTVLVSNSLLARGSFLELM